MAGARATPAPTMEPPNNIMAVSGVLGSAAPMSETE